MMVEIGGVGRGFWGGRRGSSRRVKWFGGKAAGMGRR